MLDFIDLPDYFDRNKFFNAFQTLETKALYKYFRCNNSTTFTNLMSKYFPDRPLGKNVAEYVCELIEDEDNFNKELRLDPRVQQAEVVKPTAKSFMSMKPKEEEKVPEPEHLPQPRIRTEEDIWYSQQLFKDAGRTAQNQWLKAGHPDPKLETIDNLYAEVDVFTKFS